MGKDESEETCILHIERKKVGVEVGQVGRRLNSLGFSLPNLFPRLGRLGCLKRKSGTLADAPALMPVKRALLLRYITLAQTVGIAIHGPLLSSGGISPTAAT
jgi:hypothetical protein